MESVVGRCMTDQSGVECLLVPEPWQQVQIHDRFRSFSVVVAEYYCAHLGRQLAAVALENLAAVGASVERQIALKRFNGGRVPLACQHLCRAWEPTRGRLEGR